MQRQEKTYRWFPKPTTICSLSIDILSVAYDGRRCFWQVVVKLDSVGIQGTGKEFACYSYTTMNVTSLPHFKGNNCVLFTASGHFEVIVIFKVAKFQQC